MYPYCCLHIPDQAMQSLQQAKIKRASGRPFSPQAKGPEDMWLNLRNLLGKTLLTQARHAGGSHTLHACSAAMEWEAPEPTGVGWGQVLALTSQYGGRQECSYSWMFLSMSGPSVFLSQISCSLIALLLQNQQVGLAQPPIRWQLLPWGLVYVEFCVHCLRVNIYFPPACGTHAIKPSKTNALRVHLPSARALGLSLMWMELRTLTPVGEPLQYNDSAIFWFAHPSGLIISQVHPLYPSHCGSFFMSLVVGDLWNEPGKVPHW